MALIQAVRSTASVLALWGLIMITLGFGLAAQLSLEQRLCTLAFHASLDPIELLQILDTGARISV